MLVRALLLAVALAAGGWLAVQARSARAERQLTQLAFETPGRLSPAQLAHGRALLKDYGRLNPDNRAGLFEGLLLAHAGRERAGIARVAATARAEPENLEAWALLASLAERADPALAERARAQARRLAPSVRTPRPTG